MDRLLTTTATLITLVTTIASELSVVPCAADAAASTSSWKVSSYVMQSIHARGSHHRLRQQKLQFGCNRDPSSCNHMHGLTAASNASTCCNGFCKDTEFDSNNCGGCNSGCHYGFSCCFSSCVNLYADANNCGHCGVVCSGSPCAFGLCNYG